MGFHRKVQDDERARARVGIRDVRIGDSDRRLILSAAQVDAALSRDAEAQEAKFAAVSPTTPAKGNPVAPQ